MKIKDIDKTKSNMTFSEKLSMFNNNQQYNYIHRKTTVYNCEKKEDKPINDFEKKLQMFQPRRTIVATNNQLNLNEIKKREYKYNLKTEREPNKERRINKTKISSTGRKKFEKTEIMKPNKKLDKKETSKKRKGDISFSNINSSVSEKIRKLNQIEDKNRIKLNNNNNKGTIKSIEQINNFNYNDKNICYQKDNENEKNITNNISNKNKNINNILINNNTTNNNTNYIKEIKEISSKTKRKENKNENHNSKDEQNILEPKNINCENKKILQNNNFKDIIPFLEKEKLKKINKIEINEDNKKIEEEKNVNININKELKNFEKNDDYNNNYNENYNQIMETSKYVNKKPSNTVYIPKQAINPPKRNNIIPKNKQDNDFNINKRLSKQININNAPNITKDKKEIQISKKETIEKKK